MAHRALHGSARLVMLACAVSVASVAPQRQARGAESITAQLRAALVSVPAASAAELVTITDLAAAKRALGLPRDLGPNNVRDAKLDALLTLQALRAGYASPFEGRLRPDIADPLGLEPLSITGELTAGRPGGALALVVAPGAARRMEAKLGQSSFERSKVDGTTVFVSERLALDDEITRTRIGLGVVAFGKAGVAGGWRDGAPKAVAALAAGRKAGGGSAADDPRLAKAWPLVDPDGRAQYLSAGSSLCDEGAPRLCVYSAEVRSATEIVIRTATVFDDAAAAKAFAPVAEQGLREGASLATGAPRRDLFTELRVTVRDRAVVVELRERKAATVSAAIVRRDYPPFLSPAR